ncbi:MAG: hypothetical protein ACK5DD_15250 [Cyclobacteriaceae bacterium]
MTKSTPNMFRVTLMRVWVILTIGSFLILVVDWLAGLFGMNGLGLYFTIIALFAGLIGLLIELPEARSLTIYDDKITVKNLLTRKSTDFLFTTIDGFRISMHMQRYGGLKLNLILLKQGHSHHPISLSYIANATEIINELEKRIPNSTEDEYRFLELIKK